MSKMNLWAMVGVVGCALVAAGCGSSGADRSVDDGFPAPTPKTATDARNEAPRELVESDLYKVVGSTIYTYNFTRGLYAIDVSDPQVPSIRSHEDVFGPAGEIYADSKSILLLLDESSTACEPCGNAPESFDSSEVVALTDGADGLQIESRTCMPGKVVASRMLGHILYAVTYDDYQQRSLVISVDVGNVSQIELVDLVELEVPSQEIHMTNNALFVAHPVTTQDEYGWETHDTLVSYFDISNPQGLLVQEGSVQVKGKPLGRFHMDAMDTTFRIVTFDEYYWSTNLTVIDTSDPSEMSVLGTLENIAPGEEIHATRFVDHRAYVVTFQQTDPLWVIDLQDPSRPEIIGELWVPGWSDFIFPRGEELLTVGRGTNGGVSVALFDISDPHAPIQTDVVEVGYWDSTSEALADFRGVRTIGAGEHCDTDLVSIPVSTWTWDYETNTEGCEDRLHLIDLKPGHLELRGNIELNGAIRRSLPVHSQLYAITDLEVASIDIADRDQPVATTVLETGDAALAGNPCTEAWGDWGGGMPMDDVMWADDVMACHVSAPGARGFGGAVPALGLLGFGLVVIGVRRRRTPAPRR